MLEIERKFLVTSDSYKQEAQKKTRITQGYLSTDPERTVRVRIKGEKGFLMSLPGVIDKTRYEIPQGKHTWEVDEFYEDNQGLTVAEIELSTEDESFKKPKWLGKEVTGDKKYYNSQLSENPFKKW